MVRNDTENNLYLDNIKIDIMKKKVNDNPNVRVSYNRKIDNNKFNSFIKKIQKTQEIKKQQKLDDVNKLLCLTDNKYKNYEHVINYKITNAKLKNICKTNNLTMTGVKKELINRLYNYLRWSHYSTKIQSMFRAHLRQKLNKVKMISFKKNKNNKRIKNNDECVNETDFLTLTNISDLPYEQLMYVYDNKHFKYGFDICSLFNMIVVNKQNNNPYTRKRFNGKITVRMIEIIRLSRLLKDKISVNLDNGVEQLSEKKKLELRALNLFQEMDSHGYLTDTSWFFTLNKPLLISFVKQLKDIWNYRAMITMDTKRHIYPPNGHIQFGDTLKYKDHRFELFQRKVLKLISKFINSGLNTQNKSLGVLYVLGSFTLVCPLARNSLPWLYETFRLN